jgi:hypothetical protein
MGKKEDAAIPTALEAGPEVRFSPKNRPKDEIILENELQDIAPVIPPRAEFEVLLDLYGKKARVSLMILRNLCMPLSYQQASTASSGMMRAFFCCSSLPWPGPSAALRPPSAS